MVKIKSFFSDKINLGVFSLLIFNIFTRFWRLGIPSEIVWDETYFANFAHNYLTNTSFSDVHPPLGKLIIALGIELLGFNSFGWRAMNAVFGVGFILIIFLVAQKLFKNRLAALFAAFLFTFDTFLLVESRFSLLNIYLVTFGMLGFYFLLRFLEKKSLGSLILTGIFWGLSASVKWIGISVFAVLVALYFFSEFSVLEKLPQFKSKVKDLSLLFKNLNPPRVPFYYFLLGVIVVPILIYVGISTISAKLLGQSAKDVFVWHLGTFNYHLALKESHPYGSAWWSWPLVVKPVWFYFKEEAGKILGVVEIGNVFIWWASAISLLYLAYNMVKKTSRSYFLIVIGFLVNFLPFIFISRVMFIYHYFYALIFTVLALSLVLAKLWEKKKYRFLVLGFLFLVVSFFVFFYPICIAWPISEVFYQKHMWFRSWY